METVDAGDVPLEMIVGQLLSPSGLRELIGDRAIACFALARTAVAPAFFEQLIRNVETIDATMRNHVAFIVFHGKQSSFLRPGVRRGTFDKYHIDGLSMSGDVHLRGECWGEQLRFNDALTDAIRRQAGRPFSSNMTRATEIAVSHLVKHFGIPERSLPCLLFLSSTDVDQPVIVPIARRNPIESLYLDALAPISDEFSLLERHWSMKREIARNRDGQRQAKSMLDDFLARKAIYISELDTLRAHLARIAAGENSTVVGRLAEERASLETFCTMYRSAQTLDERAKVAFKVGNAHAIQLSQQQLVDAEQEEQEMRRVWRSDATPREREALWEAVKRVNRLRIALGTAVRAPFDGAEVRLRSIGLELVFQKKSSKETEQEINKIKTQLNELEEAKKSLEKQIDKSRNSNSLDAIANFEISERNLIMRGYSSSYLQQNSPDAITVLRLLHSKNKIGKGSRKSIKANAMLKILFLAANPLTTSRLDLEEELYRIDSELRAVKHRDRIAFTAKHAARADDLVRYIRSEQPDIIHFSGHGAPDGIALRDDAGNFELVGGKALARLLKDRGVKLVVLNSCYSAGQALNMMNSVPTVVGTTKMVGDEAARRFSVAFYRTIGNGYTVGDAFRDGGDAVELHNLDDVFQMSGKRDLILIS